MKECSRCHVLKGLDSFRSHKTYADGLFCWCKDCEKQYHVEYMEKTRGSKVHRDARAANKRKWADAHPEKKERYRLVSSRRRRYGLTPEEYDAMLEAQGNVCKICGDKPEDGARLGLDHNHKTGRLRGFLCWHCNTAIGHFKDDPAILRKALEYLLMEDSVANNT